MNNDRTHYKFIDVAVAYKEEFMSMITLSCRTQVHNYPGCAIDIDRSNKLVVEQGLLDNLSKFIKIDTEDKVYDGKPYKTAIATLHLPYVYDSELSKKDKRIEELEEGNDAFARNYVQLSRRVTAFNSLPWYKKLWNKV